MRVCVGRQSVYYTDYRVRQTSVSCSRELPWLLFKDFL